MIDRHGVLVRNGFMALGSFAVLVLLAMFYSTVTGAVDRASQRRAEAADNSRLSVVAPVVPRLVALAPSAR